MKPLFKQLTIAMMTAALLTLPAVAPAQADSRHYHHGGGGSAAPWIGLGVGAALLGGALAYSATRPDYYYYYSPPAYYYPPPAYPYGYYPPTAYAPPPGYVYDPYTNTFVPGPYDRPSP